MHAGEMRAAITVEENTPTKGDAGGEVDSWSTHTTARARVETMTGREYVSAEQLTSSATHKFTMHYQAGITSAMRIVWGSRIFDIEAPPVNHEERDRWLFILAKEHGS